MKLFYKGSLLFHLLLAFIVNDRNKASYILYLLSSASQERRNPSKLDDRDNKKYLQDHDTIFEAPDDKYSLFLER